MVLTRTDSSAGRPPADLQYSLAFLITAIFP